MSWIAAILELVGICLLGRRNRYGFLCFASCGLLWIYVGLCNPGARGLILTCTVLFPFNIWYFVKWGKK